MLGRTASTCGHAAMQQFQLGARALNLEACPELRMDTVQPVEDDAASEATRPTSKPFHEETAGEPKSTPTSTYGSGWYELCRQDSRVGFYVS